MKLAEALNQRADLQRRIAQLRERLSNNVKVQEGDQPAEKPEDLFRELEAALKQLKDLIVSINRTNQETVWEGKTLTEIIAEKDVLSMHLAALRATLDATNVRNDRYSRNEIKFVRTIDVNALQKKVDYLSRDLRVLDSKLQQANWTIDLKLLSRMRAGTPPDGRLKRPSVTLVIGKRSHSIVRYCPAQHHAQAYSLMRTYHYRVPTA